jgi:nucleoside-diphosphate-sugar epimerase
LFQNINLCIKILTNKILLVGRYGKVGEQLFFYLKDKFTLESVGLSPIKNKNETYSTLDLTNKKKVRRFCKKSIIYNVLIFLVGRAHKSNDQNSLSLYDDINYKTLHNLLNGLNEFNKIPEKIIFASTISVYGEKLKKDIYSEEDSESPYSAYAKTKLKSENYLLNNYGDKTWILRFAPVYYESFLLNIQRRTKISNMFFKVGAGNKLLSLCNILNINKVIVEIIRNKIPNGKYNICDKETYTYNDLLLTQNVKNAINIPSFIILGIYYISVLFKLHKIRENSIKLISDNIFSSKKIQKYIDLSSSLYKS